MKIKFFLFILLVAFLLIINKSVLADDIAEAKQFFEKYIELCYSYDKSVPEQYSDNALIKRFLICPDKTTKVKILTVKEYRGKLKFYAPMAKIIGYKNTYSSLKFVKEGENVRIEGYRQVGNDNYKTPVSILAGQNKSGQWRILEEILYTKALIFF